ncbi:MAG: hypothetical protein JWR19_4592 [Pedosphaera sp.]|nr:hypothetical protein [Pedosphaera sp.]
MITIHRQGNASRLSMVLAGAILLLLTGSVARADMLELTNGDHYSGTVISVSPTTVEFQSEVQGRIKIPREKVAAIPLHETSASRAAAQAPVTPQPAAVVGSPAAKPAPATPASAAVATAIPAKPADSVIQQLRQQGIDPNMMNQIQQQLMGKSSPEATRMFNDTVGGLKSGSLNVSDIRNQARSAIKDIQNAKKELGDDADANELLNGYMGILEKFIQESDAPTAAPAK